MRKLLVLPIYRSDLGKRRFKVFKYIFDIYVVYLANLRLKRPKSEWIVAPISSQLFNQDVGTVLSLRSSGTCLILWTQVSSFAIWVSTPHVISFS